MKILVISLVCAWLFADLSRGESLSHRERDVAMSHLHATRKQLLDAIAGLTPAQWTYKPAPDRWSAGEIAEHLTETEDFVFKHVTGPILKQPPGPRADKPESRDQWIIEVVPDRSRKAQAPEPVRPSGRWPAREAVEAEFKARRDRSIKYIETAGEDLRGHAGKHPALGELDAYQWFLFLAAHTDRHVRQLLEVKADAAFPRR